MYHFPHGLIAVQVQSIRDKSSRMGFGVFGYGDLIPPSFLLLKDAAKTVPPQGGDDWFDIAVVAGGVKLSAP